MKKKLLILAAVAVSGLAAVVASNNNKVFSGNDADAHSFEVIGHGGYYYCIDDPSQHCNTRANHMKINWF